MSTSSPSPAKPPSTPISRYPFQRAYHPLNSSPLASPSPAHSSAPTSSTTLERRRQQFKSQSNNLNRAASHVPPSRARSISSSSGTVFASPSPQNQSQPTNTHHQFTFGHPEDPQKTLLRARIKEKCLERARKARARAVKKRRYTGYSDRSSDGFDLDDETYGNPNGIEEDEEEEDDDIMGDELFRRIMAQTNSKTNHSYRLSYAFEVGSSFDPDLEDVDAWEHELTNNQLSGRDSPPPDPLDEELEAYAEECARQAALDDFADIPEEELFHWSDVDDILDDHKATDDMDIS